MVDGLILILVYIGYLVFAAKRALTYMHAYQQEEYDSPRFARWIVQHRVFDKRLSLSLALCGLLYQVFPAFFISFLIFLAFAAAAYFEKDPRKGSKKNLNITERVKRILLPAFGLIAISGLWVFFAPTFFWLWIVTLQLIPLWIVLSNTLLHPFEMRTQKKFWVEAHNKLLDYKPTVIGITGSFGKTSVKHILGHILKMHAPTLVTPGSVNTPMGITRIIRENLQPEHQYFVVEMGAYGPGSIQRLCDLTPPDIGIITAIGHAHYERFKTLEAVAETKYELATSAIKNSGKVFVHERTLRFEYTRAILQAHSDKFFLCGETPQPTDHSYLRPGDLEIQSIEQRMEGLFIRFIWKSKFYTLEAPLYGLHHGHNLALAFATAFELGINPADIQTALSSLKQIQHRLEVKPQNDGTTIIDDAYNSNPAGFKSALELLATIGKARKILITPGMVELGKAHDDAHQKIGEYAGQICDVALVVKSERIPTFISGFKTTGGSKTLIEVETFADAQRWIMTNKQPGDTILLENDLPDIYERMPRL